MEAIFIESTGFTRLVGDYLCEDEYQDLQQELLKNPTLAPVIKGTGGLRKMRWAQANRGKGKRSGVRYYFDARSRFYMSTIYHKDEMDDLTKDDKKLLKKAVEKWTNEQKT